MSAQAPISLLEAHHIPYPLPQEDHDQHEVIRKHASRLESNNIQGIRSSHQDPMIGYGWAFSVTVDGLQDTQDRHVGSAQRKEKCTDVRRNSSCNPEQYYGRTNVEIYLPADYPKRAPMVRFRGIIYHTDITDSGFIDYNDYQYNLEWNENKTLRDVVSFCEGLLRYPLEPVVQWERSELLQFWKHHDDNDCPCALGKMLPVQYKDLIELPADEQRRLFTEFEDLYRRQNIISFHQSGSAHQFRKNSISRWQELTPSPVLYEGKWKREWFHPTFLKLMGELGSVTEGVTEEADGIFSFPMFSQKFCDLLVADVQAYEATDLPKSRPNSMNNYGLILNDMGFEGMIDLLITKYPQPIATKLTKFNHKLDAHHTFVVSYRENQDLSLDMHTDDSEVTFNVNLIDQFTGADLTFCGVRGTKHRRNLAMKYKHKRGRAVFHLGKQTHGADPLTSGERMNLIIWCRSSLYRGSSEYVLDSGRLHPDENIPDVVCLSKTHDRDYKHWLDLASHMPQPAATHTSDPLDTHTADVVEAANGSATI